MATTLTREALLNKTKPAYKEVDIKGFGRVGIRQLSELKRMRRTNQLFDNQWQPVERHNDRRRVYQLIDQLMLDEQTPMFTEEDADTLVEQCGEAFDPLIAAINRFNEELDPEKKDEGGSEDIADN